MKRLCKMCGSLLWGVLFLPVACLGGEARPTLLVEAIPALSGTPADFVVLLSNASTNQLVLLDETCSDNLRFEVLDWPAATNVVMSTGGMRSMQWPHYVSVVPGGRIAIPVRLETNTWRNLECLMRDVPWKRTLRVVYAQELHRATEVKVHGKVGKDESLVPAEVPVFEGEVSSRLYPLADILPLDNIRARIETKKTWEYPRSKGDAR